MTEQAISRVEESESAIEDYKHQISHLLVEKGKAIEALKDKWVEIVDDNELNP